MTQLQLQARNAWMEHNMPSLGDPGHRRRTVQCARELRESVLSCATLTLKLSVMDCQSLAKFAI